MRNWFLRVRKKKDAYTSKAVNTSECHCPLYLLLDTDNTVKEQIDLAKNQGNMVDLSTSNAILLPKIKNNNSLFAGNSATGYYSVAVNTRPILIQRIAIVTETRGCCI